MPILFLTRALNAVLLPLLVLPTRMSRGRDGRAPNTRAGTAAQALTTGVLGVCVVALLVLTVLPS